MTSGSRYNRHSGVQHPKPLGQQSAGSTGRGSHGASSVSADPHSGRLSQPLSQHGRLGSHVAPQSRAHLAGAEPLSGVGVTASAASYQSVGATLQAMRIRRGRTLDELAASTRIPRRILDSLERDDFSSLAAPVYVKGFLRSVCRELGYDPREVAQQYESTLFQQAPGSNSEAPILALHTGAASHSRDFSGASAPTRGLRMAHAVLLFVAALTFLGAILTAAFRDGASVSERPEAAIRGASSVSAAAASPSGSSSGSSSGSAAGTSH